MEGSFPFIIYPLEKKVLINGFFEQILLNAKTRGISFLDKCVALFPMLFSPIYSSPPLLIFLYFIFANLERELPFRHLFYHQLAHPVTFTESSTNLVSPLLFSFLFYFHFSSWSSLL